MAFEDTPYRLLNLNEKANTLQFSNKFLQISFRHFTLHIKFIHDQVTDILLTLLAIKLLPDKFPYLFQGKNLFHISQVPTNWDKDGFSGYGAGDNCFWFIKYFI